MWASSTASCGPCRPLLEPSATTEVVDATGKWVTPGFVDVHTHYDAEVLVGPGLEESVRHGVTTVLLGNCSLSTLYSTPVDIADLFSRVEALPRDHVLKAVDAHKTWTSPEEYIAALEHLPLGPNIAALVGHSDLRAHVMGLDRSTDRSQKPTREEWHAMSDALEKALDAGLLGMSTMTNPWDKLDGDRYRSRSLPSSYARWSEFRSLHKILRRRGRLLQSIPNLNTKYDMLFFLASATGVGRTPLKISLLAAADAKASPWIHRVFGPLARMVNGPGKGQFRWQHLPTTFDVYSDGIDLVVFEEFGSGRAALHLRESWAATSCCPTRPTAAGSVPTSRRSSARASGIATSPTPRSPNAPTPRSSERTSRRSRPSAVCTWWTHSSIWWSSTAESCAGTRRLPIIASGRWTS